jgi:dTDP-glucose 4,6-dehydratase
MIRTAVFPKGRYLVTGGAGFLGSHLCEALVERGCEVVAVDNFLTGRPTNLRSLMGQSLFSLLEHDITRPLAVKGGLAGIFHFASPASPIDYAKFPIETLRVGALGSDHILGVAQEKNCPILVASTSEVYGDPLEHPQKESYWGNVNPIGPRGCYDESKRYLEALTMAYHRKHSLKTRIIRIFNTYGPRMRTDDGRVVPNFCIQALTNQDITVNGDGKQTRSFCYVSDLVEGILCAFQNNDTMPVNLGNPSEKTILEFAQTIVSLAGSTSKIAFRPMPEDDPKTRRPDITRAKSVLGWEPRVSLEEGLKKTFEYFKQTLERA